MLNIESGDYLEALVDFHNILKKGEIYEITLVAEPNRETIIKLKNYNLKNIIGFCYLHEGHNFFKKTNLTTFDKEIDDIETMGYPYA